MQIILASKSPRRKELLSLVVPNFEIMVSNEDEVLQEGLSIKEQAINLSYIKAKNIYNRTTGNRIIIGSDSMVVKEGKIYGKPHSREHAKEMIMELLKGDRTHTIITGLAVIVENDGVYKEYKTYDEVKVYLNDMSDMEIEYWLDKEKYMDKAGAYGIQDEFCFFVRKIEGNYTTAVGLPVHRVYEVLAEIFNGIV